MNENERYNFVLTRKRLKKTRPSLQWCGHSERVASVRERQELGAGLLARGRRRINLPGRGRRPSLSPP